MWSAANATEAAQQGWGVFDVWTGKALVVTALPLNFTAKMPHAPAMLQLIIAQAKAGDTLCLAALQHITSKGVDVQTHARRKSRRK